ncbi:MAG TPA: hypothetical protein VMM36_14630 [Opitutaceae bacterium]|nr:hypothetical protein [Opitutaceae bacterium]
MSIESERRLRHDAIVRALCLLLLLIAAAGCSRPPSVASFDASPLPSAFASLHSPNGQRQVLLVRTGSRWQGHLDDSFAATAHSVVAETDDGSLPEILHPADLAEPPIEIAGWRQTRDAPVLIVESWAAGDPALRASGPSAIVSMIRVAGDSFAIAAINATLAAELEGAVGLAAPVGETLTDPGAVASRVAIEAAVRVVVDEESGAVNPRARIAVFQIPVLLNRRFLAVEHQIFEDHGNEEGAASPSRFTLHNLETGESPDPDALLDPALLARLAALAGETTASADWYVARPGIVLVTRDAHGAESRRVVPWRDALPLLPADSPLRDVAESLH